MGDFFQEGMSGRAHEPTPEEGSLLSADENGHDYTSSCNAYISEDHAKNKNDYSYNTSATMLNSHEDTSRGTNEQSEGEEANDDEDNMFDPEFSVLVRHLRIPWDSCARRKKQWTPDEWQAWKNDQRK
ncbi:unnamed protein product, partial [Amoebophrya sp. A25]|eukprot:GSA25T00020566001.1